jgi:class 3 adenylate cyclase
VAILFTDMVGSTELSQRLAPDAAHELRREHFFILRQALAEAGGTEVKNLGDGLMVVFGSASRRCRAPWPCSRASSATTGPGSYPSVCASA